MRWTKEQYNEYQRKVERERQHHPLRPPSPKPKPDVLHEPLVKDEAKAQDTRRHVTVSSYRVRLCDPDNLCVKPFIDGLRYCGVINDDTTNHITITVQQFKVKTRKEEKTVINVKESNPHDEGTSPLLMPDQ